MVKLGWMERQNPSCLGEWVGGLSELLYIE